VTPHPRALSAFPLRAATLAAAIVLAAPVGAGAVDPARAVMAVTQQACDAFRDGDVPRAERLLAPGFTLVGTDAQVQTRQQVLAELRTGEPRYEVFRNHSMSAQVFGNAAVVQGITTLKGSAGGKSFEADVRFTDTLIRERGQWRLVASHVTKIPGR